MRKLVAGALVLVAVGVGLLVAGSGNGGRVPTNPSPTTEETPRVPKKAYLANACDLPDRWMQRVWRGWRPGPARSHDLVLVPNPPNYMGTATNTSHSGPYDYLQEVPLVFYGPGFIEPTGPIRPEREVTIADLAPTYGALMEFDFPPRHASVIDEVLTETDRLPRLIVTLVADGAGSNVLELWPDAWPNLAELMRRGASVEGAVVGSSPSITPSTHTNLSTGTWPRYHGVTGIAIHRSDGTVGGAFTERSGDSSVAMDPRYSLQLPTIADLWDKSQNNGAKVAYVANGNFALGMLGFGAALKGGDRDIAAAIQERKWATNPDFYSLPEYLNTDVDGPERDIKAVDQRDGELDDQWRGHEIAPLDATPALAPWIERTIVALIDREGFGDDDVTDLLFANIKTPDAAGHRWNMIAPEQSDAIASVDDAIGALVDWLDNRVGRSNYVFVVTADHGQTPLEAGGWPISRSELLGDISRRFDTVDNGRGLIQQTSATSLFASIREMKANGVAPEDIASFLSNYTIGDNIADGAPTPDGFEGRAADRIFAAVVPGRELPRVMRCMGLQG